ncbi:MAG: Holliday junction branch migration protein RuvA [Gemmatimonadetes bacterium]|nr:Holliday junction branch migration protein RuvA [Gemmatimonadota bacterium]
MIEAVRGRLVRSYEGRVIVEVGGLELGIVVPSTSALIGRGAGEEIRVPTHLHVREDALELYGFAHEEERTLFKTLLGISGIGPRLALSIVGAIDPLSFARSIATGDHGTLQRAPGVGRKLAERMLLELRDRYVGPNRALPKSAANAPPAPWDDAATALITLGYDRSKIAHTLAILREDPGDSPSTDAIVRAALKRLRG